MEITAIVVAAVSSAALFNFIQYLIARKDKKKDALGGIEKGVKELKEELYRTQMLLLMADYPDQIAELMECAEKYFVELNGDFYMSSLFRKWLKANNIPEPIWLKKGAEK